MAESIALGMRLSTATELASAKGIEGEISVVEGEWRAVVHDGVTKGGYPVAKKSEVDGAIQTANSASSTASAAKTAANEAKNTASSAVTTANGAVTTANTAKTTAEGAVKTANTASTNASSAKTSAESAVSTANTAKSTADTAKSTADSALAKANKAVQKVNGVAPGTDGNVEIEIGSSVHIGDEAPSGNEANLWIDTDESNVIDTVSSEEILEAVKRASEGQSDIAVDSVLPVAQRNVGDEWISYTGILPVGGVPYCGQLVSRDVYSDLWEYVQTQGLVKTDSEWQSIASAQNGNVAFYSMGDGSTTFRMPSIKGYVKGASSQSEAGEYAAEGLPNIEGEAGGFFHTALDIGEPTGPFAGNKTYGNGNVTTGNTSRYAYFDASKANPIYGNSDHVTPETNTVLFGVFAFGNITNVGNLNAETLATGLATVEANKLERSDKAEIAGWGMPDYSSTVSIGTGEITNFPCDAIGYAEKTWSDQTLAQVTIDGEPVWRHQSSSGHSSPTGGQFFIPKGCTLNISDNVLRAYYWPLKGAK